MRVIQVVNHSTVVTKSALADVTKALQLQLERDFSPVWGSYVALALVESYDQTKESMLILDDATQADALGYHALVKKTRTPVGFVFARTSAEDGVLWSVPYSHEVHEQAVDPFCAAAWVGVWESYHAAIALETDDAVEMDTYDVLGFPMSNFVFPGWFDVTQATPGPLDQMGKVSKPCEIRPGGYMSVTMNLQSWSEYTHEKSPRSLYRSNPAHRMYSRSSRRRWLATI
jgi:hypothetical protein